MYEWINRYTYTIILLFLYHISTIFSKSLSDSFLGNSIAIFIKITECIFKPEIAQDALKKKGFKFGGSGGFEDAPRLCYITECCACGESYAPPTPNYILPFCPPRPKSWKKPWTSMGKVLSTQQMYKFTLSSSISLIQLHLLAQILSSWRMMPNLRLLDLLCAVFE